LCFHRCAYAQNAYLSCPMARRTAAIFEYGPHQEEQQSKISSLSHPRPCWRGMDAYQGYRRGQLSGRLQMTLSIHCTTDWPFEKIAGYGPQITAAFKKLVERFPTDITLKSLA